MKMEMREPAAGTAAPSSSAETLGRLHARIPFRCCPLCGADHSHVLKEAICRAHALYQAPLPDTITWLKCEMCDHVYTSGFFSRESQQLLFSRANATQTVGYDFENKRVLSARQVERVNACRNYRAVDARWLDVGFGDGSLLFTAAEFGYEVFGLDLREDLVKNLQSLGFGAAAVQITELRSLTAQHFAVISMCDVLEHMEMPHKALRAAHELLSPSGVLLLSMPAYDSPVWQFMDGMNCNPYWGEIEHYHNFSRSRLYKLLLDHGFANMQYHISDRYRACMEIIARRIEA